MESPVIIVGAGLSGLRAASLLTERGIDCRILEARDRIGGRVFSQSMSDGAGQDRFDLGPTWFWPDYERSMTDLVNELKIETFDQYTEGAMLSERSWEEAPKRFILPEGSSLRSMRFTGGVQSLIEALADSLPSGMIELESKVKAIRLDESDVMTVEAELADGRIKEWTTDAVILALPPRIVAHQIEFTPSLDANLISTLMDKPTWMAGQAKVIVSYERPFWRELGLSGFATSTIGPLQEIHDASSRTGAYALFGFLGIPANIRQQLAKDQIIEAVIEQFVRLFGEEARKVNHILYKDWAEEPETAVDDDLQPLKNFPQYGPPILTGIWKHKIMFAGTETSTQSGGHLDGALQSAERAVSELIRSQKNLE